MNLFEAGARAASAGVGGAPATAAATSGAANPLAGLMQHPQFQRMRELISTQPHLIQPLLQQIAQTNPQLLRVN